MQSFKNGKIFTGLDTDGNPVFEEAMSIENGLITFIGKNKDLKSTEAIMDLESKLVIPGFIDSHTHPDYVAANANRLMCLPPIVNSIQDIIDGLKEHKDFGKKDIWLEGFGYDEAVLKDGRSPNCKDLDKISTEQIVLAYHSSGHIITCNSAGLKLAGITRDTPDPQGGKIGHFEDGEPNGILYEPNAQNLLMSKKPKTDFNILVDEMVALGKRYEAMGVSATTDMMCFYDPYNRIEMYKEARKKGFKQSITLYYHWDTIKKHNKKPIINDDPCIKIGGVKLFIDGSISGKTAYMLRNYPGENHRGMMVIDKETILEAVDYARDNHLQVAIHSMGDASLEFLIETLKDFEPWMGDETPTIRIEHASLISDKQLQTMKEAKMNFALAPQTIFLYAEYEAYLKNLDHDLFRRVYAVKSYNKYLLTSLSSDAPATLWAEPENLYYTLKASVYRHTPDGRDMNIDEAISVGLAIQMLSINGAIISNMPNEGALKVGKYANFQILKEDIFKIDSKLLDEVLPEYVYIKGVKVKEPKKNKRDCNIKISNLFFSLLG